MFSCDDQRKFWIFLVFLENENFFKELEYRFLVERTEIEKASLPYKTAISEANVKTNRMVTAVWAYHRERTFTSDYFIFFLKFCFSLTTSYE